MSSIRKRLQSVFTGKDKKDFEKEKRIKDAEAAKKAPEPAAKDTQAAKPNGPAKIDTSDKIEKEDPKKMPKSAEVNKRFEKVLKYRGIQTNDKRYKVMMAKPTEEKWKIVLLHEKSISEQENSFKIKEAPEYYVHCLKEAPTKDNLQELSKMLRTKPEDWVKKFLQLDGLGVLFEVLAGTSESQAEEIAREKRETAVAAPTNKEPQPSELAAPTPEKKKDEEEHDDKKEEDAQTPATPVSAEAAPEPQQQAKIKVDDRFDILQSECIKAIRTLMNAPLGMRAFLESEKSKLMIARCISSENIKTKTQIFFLLSTVCVFSEDGFFLTLDAINQYKAMKRETVRFTSIVQQLVHPDNSEDMILCKIAIMIFINSLITAPQDTSTKRQIKKEFRDLKMGELIEKLKKDDADDTLMIQIGVFEEEMDESEEVEEEVAEVGNLDNLENPNEILKLIRVQLSGSSAFEHFVNILQYFLIISGKSSEGEKVENMSILESIIKKAIMTNEDGSVENISVKELQLHDRVVNQQKKIIDYEDKLTKLTAMMKSGKMDPKMLDGLVANIKVNEKNTNFKIDDPEVAKKVMAETQALLSKIKPSSGLVVDDNVDLPAKEYREHIKKLEAEVKFLTYKLKTSDKKGGSGSGSNAAPSTPTQGSGGPPAPPNSNNAAPPAPPKSNDAPPAPPSMGGPPPPPPPMGMGGPPPPPPPPMGMGGPPPPPPPPMGMGGPPPPPPPMGMGGPPPPPPMGMGGPPPPPGLGMGAPRANALPALPNVKASVPMKAVFWNNVPNQKLKDSIWLKKELVQHLAAVELDTSELENLFSAKKEQKEEKLITKKAVERVSLVDPKKAQNAAIILGSMRMPNKDIRKAILEMDEAKLAAESIKALKDLSPTSEEIETVKAYTGDVNLLGPTEQFYREILDIPRFELRLAAWMFKLKFLTSYNAIQPDIENVTSACKELQESEKFMKLLEVVLAIGNFLNSGRKGAHGFQLNSLLKLKDTKATGAKTDLLEYIITFMEKKYPDAITFAEELEHLEPSTRVAIANVQSELNELKTGLTQVANEIEAQGDGVDASDQFRMVMIEFLDDATEKVEELENAFKEMNTQVEKLAVFFGEDEKKFKAEQFLNEMNEFSKSFAFTFSEILRKREAEQKKLERENKKKEKEMAATTKSAPTETRKRERTVLKKSKDGEGLLDSTIDALADGAFKKSKKTKKLKGSNLDVDDVMNMLKTKDSKDAGGDKKKKKKVIEGDDLD